MIGNLIFKRNACNYVALLQLRYKNYKNSGIKNKSLDLLNGKSRMFSTKAPAVTSSVAIPDLENEFMSYFPDIVKELKEKAKIYDPLETGKHIERVSQYNVPHGKKLRGMILLETFKRISPQSSSEDFQLAAYLAWCLELLHSSFLISDDIMDGSLYRRSKLCWYKNEDVGLSAINDALLLESSIYLILRDHFSNLKCYVKLLELLHESTFIFALGQQTDTSSSYQDVLSFTVERHRTVAINKASYYSLYVPVVLATHLAGFTEQKISQQTKSVLMELGVYFQAQNDYLDCYGKSVDSGVFSTDIQAGKCTWLAVTFLQRANAAQKAIMKESYGKSDEESITRVKQLYSEVKLEEAYFEYEENMYNMLKKQIEQSSEIPRVCLHMMDKIRVFR